MLFFQAAAIGFLAVLSTAVVPAAAAVFPRQQLSNLTHSAAVELQTIVPRQQLSNLTLSAAVEKQTIVPRQQLSNLTHSAIAPSQT